MIFLVGLIRQCDRDGSLVVEQYLARDYGEERAILESFGRTTEGHEVLVTFNGKAFDWPLVHNRTTYHQLPQPAATADASMPAVPFTIPRDLFHCDLLHHARRHWRHLLSNCRLQTLERMLCGRTRSNDIPGRRIPRAYHDFVRTGRTDELDQILHHNALDLVTLVQLTLRVIAPTNL